MATLTVYLPAQIQSITFTNGETASNRQSVGYASYTSGVKISSISLGAGYSTWSGTLYWNNGRTDFAFGTVANGVVSIYSSSSQEQIDYTGNRTITVKAVATTKYYYRVVVYGRQDSYGGTAETKYYPSSSTWYETSTAGNQTFSLSNVSLTAPTGYGLLGYAYNATPTSGETLYTSSITVGASTSGTVTNIHAVWGRYYYRVRYFLQDGSGESYYYPSDASAFSVSGSFTFDLSNLPTPTRSGYAFVGWAYNATPSEGETAYTSTIQLSSTSTSSSSPTICNIHAVWREQISPFYWFGNETDDKNKVKQGQPRKMDAEMWDNFADAVDALASICGISVSIDRPRDGTPMKHEQYNSAVSALAAIKSSKPLKFIRVTIPNPVGEGDIIAASQFQGTGSIKGALNAMIALL